MPRVLTRRPTAFRVPALDPTPPVTPELRFRARMDPRHPALPELGLHQWLVEIFELGVSTDPKCLPGRLLFTVRNAAGQPVGYAGRWADEPVPGNRARYRYHAGRAERSSVEAAVPRHRRLEPP